MKKRARHGARQERAERRGGVTNGISRVSRIQNPFIRDCLLGTFHARTWDRKGDGLVRRLMLNKGCSKNRKFGCGHPKTKCRPSPLTLTGTPVRAVI